MEVENQIAETFKPMFLHHDKDRTKKITKLYRDSIAPLNALIHEAEKALDRKLTDEEKQSIAKGSIFYLDELKNKFPFPKSTEDFNYTAMGIDIKTLNLKKEAYKGSKHEYTLENGIFIESEQYLEEIAKGSDIYTTNEKQNQILQAAKKMLEAYEVLISLSNNQSYIGFAKQEVDRFIFVDGGQLAINHYKILEK